MTRRKRMLANTLIAFCALAYFMPAAQTGGVFGIFHLPFWGSVISHSVFSILLLSASILMNLKRDSLVQEG